MARNVLLSFLGLSDYKPCFYTYQGETSSYTRFVQTAIYELFKKDGEMDVVIFSTKEAEKNNWIDRVNEENQLVEGLKTTFHRIDPKANIKLVVIDSSQDERANWQLFDAILNEIQEGDCIYFDITHSFRTIPFVSLIVLNYARLVKKASIGKIMYGFFEKLGNPRKVDNIPVEKRLVPIIDVTNMAALLDWTNGVDQFIRTGDATVIQQFTSNEVKKIYTDPDPTIEERKQVSELRELANQLDMVGKLMQTARSLQIAEEIKKFREQLNKVRNIETDTVKPLIPLLDEMEKKYENFTEDPFQNLFAMADWCEKNQLIQPGLTLLQENVVTAICRLFRLDETNKDIRTDLHSAIRILLERIPEEDWQVKNPSFVADIVEKLKPYRDLLKPFNPITEYRNDINHAGTRTDARPPQKFYQQLSESIQKFKPFFEEVSNSSKNYNLK
ncbi:TIGR02221 family CRISPR-associated protein [Aeribacillus sp. FSL K6-2848]|uniref:TIGR02221 family CRISPR-associated protein n=1 Tax=Aeribacillus sp. FSL K6-2848 TaxID=2954612 RepID=UPI0030F741A6